MSRRSRAKFCSGRGVFFEKEKEEAEKKQEEYVSSKNESSQVHQDH